MAKLNRDSIVVCTYGPSGIGKTTDQGFSFPRALFVAAPGALNSIRTTCGYTPATTPATTIMDTTKLIRQVAGQFNTIVVDDFSFLAEQTFSALEKKFKGFVLWGELRDAALEFRDVARFSGVDVILNCFSRKTEFITDEGVKSFAQYEDGDEVTVLTHKGRWRRAKVRAYGQREMNTITLRRGPARHTVKATPDHRWLLHDGTETTALREGMCLMDAPPVFASWSWETATAGQREMWVRGFILGDGTTNERGYTSVRLCGAKADFAQRFVDVGGSVSFPPSMDGEPLVYFGDRLAKGLPALSCGPALLQAFVAGYLDADGHKNKNRAAREYAPFTGIQTSSGECAAFIRAAFPVAGAYRVSEVKVEKETNFGHVSADWFTLMLGQADHPVARFYVESIKASTPEEAWCLVVDDDSSFVLPWGLPTGNCWEQGPKVAVNGARVRGGPMLSGKLPEQIPAMCDLVLRASLAPARKPWGAVYRCSLDPNFIMKDRFNIVSVIDPAPMNLAEILRAGGIAIERHPDAQEQEEIVEKFSQQLQALDNPTAQLNDYFKRLKDTGLSVPAARWILRDSIDRATIRKALDLANSEFITTTTTGNTLG